MVTLVFASFVIIIVLLGPVFVAPIGRNVEVFFLVIGVLTALMMGQFSPALVWGAVSEPLGFTVAVLVFGAGFRLSRRHLDQLFRRVIETLNPRMFFFLLATALGFLGAFITPVVAALVFVEAISLLRCDRATEIAATVFACFAIGIGAGLTPLGMPGLTVVLRSLHGDFWYLAHLLGPFIIVGVILTAALTMFLPITSSKPVDEVRDLDSWKLVLLVRPGRVYVFIAGLVALSDGLRPLVDAYLHRIPTGLLYWMNTISAVVNNSTLAAVEIGPSLSRSQQRSALLGLLLSGGALVTGNIPNIVAASRLGITSREWARIGLGTASALLILCFAILSGMAFFG
jgi:predicted cation transporter